MTTFDSTTPSKKCTKCLQELPRTLEFFSPDKRKSDGLQCACRECYRQKSHEYYHSDRGQAQAKTYNQRSDIKKKHSEYERKRVASLSPEKRAEIRTWQKKHYEENKELIMGKQREYLQRPDVKERTRKRQAIYKKTPIAKLNNRAYKSRRRARELATGGTVKSGDIRMAYKSQKGRCWHCSKHVGEDFHVDHLIPIAKGGSSDPRNLVISCAHCNHKKRDLYCWQFNGKLF